MNQQKYTFRLIPYKDGGYTILSKDYSGLISEADSRDEVVSMATDALEMVLRHSRVPAELLNGTKIKKLKQNQFQLVVDMDTRKVIDSIFPGQTLL